MQQDITRLYLILQVPDSIAMRKLVVCRAALGQDTTLKAAHVEEQVRIVLAVDRDEAVLPQSGRH